MSEKRCETCQRFAFWGGKNEAYYDGEPEGVCTSPRPLLGSQPNREVRRKDGRNCPMWQKVTP